MEISVFSSFCELIKGMLHDDFRMSLFKRPGVSGIIRHTASASLSGLPFGVHPVCPASESSLCPHQNPEAGFIPLKNLDRGPPAVAERNMQREYGSS